MVYCDIEKNKVCLPDVEECENLSEIVAYMDRLYLIFKHDFIEDIPKFNNKKILIRKEPLDNGKEHAFIHLTHEDFSHQSNDPNDRVPDFRRSERLPWVKKIIENYECSIKNDCGKILYWEELYRGYKRINLLYEDERFVVVLEERKYGFILITAFYIDKDWALEKRIRKYERYEKQKTPLT